MGATTSQRSAEIPLPTEGRPHMVRRAKQGSTKRPWVAQLLERKKPKVAAVALANKNARIIWAMMATGEAYREAELAAA